MSIRVLLADDHALVRAGFKMILEAAPDIEVVGEAEDGHQAVEISRDTEPDVVLMDIQMPSLNGIEATRALGELKREEPIRVLILTTFERDEYVFQSLQAGASGFLLKNAPPEDLIKAVRVVAAGESLLAPSITRRIIEEFAKLRPRHDVTDDVEGLTGRELEVLRALALGFSNAELAERLHVTEGTVKTHVSSLLSKLGLRDRVQAVVFAYESGVAQPGAASGIGPPVAPAE